MDKMRLRQNLLVLLIFSSSSVFEGDFEIQAECIVVKSLAEGRFAPHTSIQMLRLCTGFLGIPITVILFSLHFCSRSLGAIHSNENVLLLVRLFSLT